MKSFLTFGAMAIIAAAMCINPAKAAPVDSSVAKKVASNFYNYELAGRNADSETPHLAWVGTDEQKSGIVCFYVFNFDNGFVIVSAEDKVSPILAFSQEAPFDVHNCPVNMRLFLRDYVQAISQISNVNAYTSKIQEWNELLVPSVSIQVSDNMDPLIQTKWDQGKYYNNCCPLDSNGPNGHAYTGCIATVMGQLIRYWEYPTSGFGSHSYMANNSEDGHGDYGMLSVNFAEAHYHYDLMPATLSYSSTDEEVDAVATLLFHCGVSVDMRYGSSGSGAATLDVPNAMQQYFGYPECHYEYRNDYSDSLWAEMVKAELDAGRPLYYNGHIDTNGGGHAFICDAYRFNDYFHFNWGWSGNGNGYFRLSNLHVGQTPLNTNQGAIFGLHAPNVNVESLDTPENILCYPNPTTGNVNFSIADLSASPNVEVRVYDVYGKQVLATSPCSNSGTVSLEEFPSGVYLLRFYTDGKMISNQKIVKTGR